MTESLSQSNHQSLLLDTEATTVTDRSNSMVDSPSLTNLDMGDSSSPLMVKTESSMSLNKFENLSPTSQGKFVQNSNASINTSSTSSINNSSNNNTPLNEKVAHLASSIYTELEKIVKLHGRDTVKDLMPIVVNILEGLDTAYQDKEELTVENELLKDDYEKLLSQYEREKQARKDTELV
jgi:hypothetical protein